MFSILENNRNIFSIASKDILIVSKLINELFPFSVYGRHFQNKLNNHLSINNPLAFDRYFVDIENSNILSEKEFIEARFSGLTELCEKINIWNENREISLEVINRLKLIEEFESASDFENIIQAIIYHSNLEIIDSLAYSSGKNMYSGRYEDFVYKIGLLGSEYSKYIIDKYYNKNDKDYLSFVSKVLCESDKIDDFEAAVIYFILKSNYTEVLSKNILINGLIKNLSLKISSSDKFTSGLFHLYENIIRASFIGVESTVNRLFVKEEVKQVNEIFKRFILERDVETFIELFIWVKPDGFSLIGWIDVIFNSKEEFICKFRKLKSPYKEEFLLFYEELKQINIDDPLEWRPISFIFKIIKIPKGPLK